jgi:hypothetical protein
MRIFEKRDGKRLEIACGKYPFRIKGRGSSGIPFLPALRAISEAGDFFSSRSSISPRNIDDELRELGGIAAALFHFKNCNNASTGKRYLSQR